MSSSTRALDVGCAATGRSARVLAELGAEVTSIELNIEAIREFAERDDRGEIELAVADMTRLPFADESFDLVLVAFHGYDYLHEAADRVRAIMEFDRILVPGGVLVLNAYNRTCCWVYLDQRPSLGVLKHQIRYFANGGPFVERFSDMNGLTIRQAAAGKVRREVEANSSLRFEAITDRKGRETSWRRGALLSPDPYYLFTRP